jgi:hypothetical protein
VPDSSSYVCAVPIASAGATSSRRVLRCTAQRTGGHDQDYTTWLTMGLTGVDVFPYSILGQ